MCYTQQNIGLGKSCRWRGGRGSVVTSYLLYSVISVITMSSEQTRDVMLRQLYYQSCCSSVCLCRVLRTDTDAADADCLVSQRGYSLTGVLCPASRDILSAAVYFPWV